MELQSSSWGTQRSYPRFGKKVMILIKLISVMILILTFLSCSAQSKVIDLTDNLHMNYILSNIAECEVLSKEMFKGAFYVNVFQMMDSKISPKNNHETEEVLSSFLVTIIPDGDYYTESNLMKIEGLLAPEFLNISEIEYPKFSISIEHGSFKERNVEKFIFIANFNN